MLRYWEILLITRGYRRRNALMYQLQRATAYSAAFCMGNPERKTVEQFLPLYIDRYIDTSEEKEYSDESIQEMLNEMNAYNEAMTQKEEGK